MTEKQELSDEQLLRYSRQIMLPAFDYNGQQALLGSRVLVIGAGGLGCPVALYLAGAGVGHLCLVDGDHVELTNLHRQIGHEESAIGESKVVSLKRAIAARNSEVFVEAVASYVNEDWLTEKVGTFDVVVDCTDNFQSRYLINNACVSNRIPLVSGAAIRMEGQVAVFDFANSDSPCYACLYPERVDQEQLTCSQAGVMGPLVGIIGAVQAMEVIKLISQLGDPLSKKLLILDAMSMQWRQLGLKKDTSCAVCGEDTLR